MPRPAAAENVFRAIADPTRRAILDQLRAGRAPVNELAAGFRMSRPAVSKHLRVLRQARLVHERRDGRQRLYYMDPVPLRDISQWLEGYRAFWQVSLSNLKRLIETGNR